MVVHLLRRFRLPAEAGYAMTLKGRVRGGTIVLDEPVELPEGTVVEIQVDDGPEAKAPASAEVPTLYDQFREFIGAAEGLPSDFARSHDHYIHGAGR